MYFPASFRYLLLVSCCMAIGTGCATIKKLNPLESNTLQARRLTREAEADVYAQDLQAAEAKLHAAIERDPNDNRSRAVLADVLWSRGAEAEAVTQMSKAVDLSEGRDVHHLIQLGQMLLTVGNPDAALLRAEEAIRLDNTAADGWTLKGFALKQRGDSRAALSAFFRSLSIRPEDAQTRTEIAKIYRQFGQPQRALAILGAPHPENLNSCPQYPEVCYLRGVLLRELNRPTDAIIALQAARDSAYDADDLLLQLAESQLAAGEVLKARATLTEASASCGPDLQVALSELQRNVDARLPGTPTLLR